VVLKLPAVDHYCVHAVVLKLPAVDHYCVQAVVLKLPAVDHYCVQAVVLKLPDVDHYCVQAVVLKLPAERPPWRLAAKQGERDLIEFWDSDEDFQHMFIDHLIRQLTTLVR
jgi:hypothetical protein